MDTVEESRQGVASLSIDETPKEKAPQNDDEFDLTLKKKKKKKKVIFDDEAGGADDAEGEAQPGKTMFIQLFRNVNIEFLL